MRKNSESLTRPDLTKELIKKEFIDNELTGQAIAKKYNCTYGLIKHYIRLYKLKASDRCSIEKKYLNKEINYLTPIKSLGRNKWGHMIFECKCRCGNITKIRSHSLASKTIKSCGCLVTKLGPNNKSYKGYKEISGCFFYQLKRGAIKRKLIFNITLEQIWNLFLKQNKKCAISGVDLIFQPSKNSNTTTASLDRIDSTKGYTIDNVQWTHKWVNIMKQDMTDKEFIDWCEIITDFNKGKKND